MDLESFERAFDSGSGSCVRHCVCGKVYYNPNNDWDWAQGEEEELAEDENAYALEHAVGLLRFEGTDYVPDCTCWHERAERIMGFLDSHRHMIAKYFNEERGRLFLLADSMPKIEEVA